MAFFNILDDFASAINNAGIPFADTIKTDALVRFDVAGDKSGSKNGYYQLFSDGIPAGFFGCWKRGIHENWCSKSNSDLTPDERNQLQQRIDENKKIREIEQEKRWLDAEKTANQIIESAHEAKTYPLHPYLAHKQIAPHGLYETDDGTLLIPIRIKNKIISLQRIYSEIDFDGYETFQKRFLSGGRISGGYFIIGDVSASTIVICEGYATGASIYETTNHCVVVAFNAGNLSAVAEFIRKQKPEATIIIAADNDRRNTKNIGVEKATIAAKQHRCYVAIPNFGDADIKLSDFNDLHDLLGGDEVARQINAAIPDKTPQIVFNAASVDVFSPLPDTVGKDMRPVATIENLVEILGRLGVTVRYDVIRKTELITIPGQSYSVDNHANASLAWIKSWCARYRYPATNISEYITNIADNNQYNPVTSWILSREWDGVSRLQQFYDTVQSKQPHKNTLMKRWMISAIAAAFSPVPISLHGVLVFCGKQGLGKTHWLKSLVPEELGVVADGITLRIDDKDSQLSCLSKWLVELGELDATFSKSAISQLKSFITKDSDSLRRAYAAKESNYQRRTAFFGSVNAQSFLSDDENRRWWVIDCISVNSRHALDMQQVWAEFHSLYANGEKWYLNEDELKLLNEHNQEFQTIDAITETIQSQFDWHRPDHLWTWKTSTEILKSIGYEKPTHSESVRCSTVVRKMNGDKVKKSNNSRLLLIPDKIDRF